MSANDQTVELGPHYASGYQHWDLVLTTGMDYLAGNATAYVTRWREKDGVKDLRKALHYTNKLLENAPLVFARRAILPQEWLEQEALDFCDVNGIRGLEAKYIIAMVTWESREDLMGAQGLLIQLLEIEDQGELMQPGSGPSTPPEDDTPPQDIDEAMRYLVGAAPGGAAPVPVEDSNRHADRAFVDRTGPAADYLADNSD